MIGKEKGSQNLGEILKARSLPALKFELPAIQPDKVRSRQEPAKSWGWILFFSTTAAKSVESWTVDLRLCSERIHEWAMRRISRYEGLFTGWREIDIGGWVLLWGGGFINAAFNRQSGCDGGGFGLPLLDNCAWKSISCAFVRRGGW